MKGFSKNIFIIYLWITFLFVFNVSAQNKIDTIISSIKNFSDASQIKYLTDLAWQYRSKDYKLALACGEKAIKLANKISNKKLAAKVLNIIGAIYRGQSNYDKSLSYSLSALSTAEQCRDSIEIAYAENNIGGTYRLRSYHTLAIEHILKGLRLFERLNYKPGIAYCELQIGLVYKEIYDNDKAIEYFELCYKIRKELKDQSGLAGVLSNMVPIFIEKRKFEIARLKLLEAEKNYLAVDDKSGLSSVWMELGEIYQQQKNYKNALSYLNRSLVLAQKIISPSIMIMDEKNIGLIYAELGKFILADLSISHALNLAYKIDGDYTTLSCLKAYSKMYELMGDYSNSFIYLKRYDSLKDSLISRENIKAVVNLEALYKNEKVRRENSILAQNLEISNARRNYWIYLTILLTIALIISRIFVVRNRLEKEKLIIRRNIAADLHDEIGSNLSSISILGQLGTQNINIDAEAKSLLEKITETARESSDSIRDIVWFINPANDTSEKLVERIIECSSKLLSGIKYDVKIPEDVFETIPDLRIRRQVCLIIKEAITNVAKHSQASFMEILTKKDDSTLTFIIRDNGIGIDEDGLHIGNGLTNMKRRAEQLNANLKISNNIDNGTQIELTLNLL